MKHLNADLYQKSFKNLKKRQQKAKLLLLLAPPEKIELTDESILSALTIELKQASLRDAVKNVMSDLDLPKKRVYDLALTLKRIISHHKAVGVMFIANSKDFYKFKNWLSRPQVRPAALLRSSSEAIALRIGRRKHQKRLL